MDGEEESVFAAGERASSGDSVDSVDFASGDFFSSSFVSVVGVDCESFDGSGSVGFGLKPGG